MRRIIYYRLTLIVTICVGWPSLRAQDQHLIFGEVQMLSPKVNSKGDELMPVLSPDGNRLYITRGAFEKNVGGRFGGQDVWVSDKNEKGEWQEAEPVALFNNRGNNAVVGIDSGGKRIYLLNSYEDNIGSKSGLSYSDQSEEGWSPPVVTKIEGIYNLGEMNSLYGLNVNELSDVLLISMNGPYSMGLEDLYVSFKFTGWNRFHQASGAGVQNEGFYWWSPPIHLGNVVNSVGYEISPFLSADGKTLFFASSRKGGFGSADIYYSTRLDDSWTNWSVPVNLGREINSRAFDAYFYIGLDSSVFFSSSRSGKFGDIYATQLMSSDEDILDKREEIFTPSKTNIISLVEEPEIPTVTSVQGLETLNRIERNILFDHNSDNLLLKDLDLLENTIAILKANERLNLHLIGHTDEIGSPRQNEILAAKRAKAVNDYLVKNGIDQSRIVTESRGESKPIADNQQAVGREQNRRVELVFGTVKEGEQFE